MKKILGLSLLLLLSAALGSPTASAQCTAYTDSSAYEGNLATGGPFCGYTGAGCTECIDWNPGTGMFFSVCYHDFGGIHCYYYSYEYQGF